MTKPEVRNITIVVRRFLTEVGGVEAASDRCGWVACDANSHETGNEEIDSFASCVSEEDGDVKRRVLPGA